MSTRPRMLCVLAGRVVRSTASRGHRGHDGEASFFMGLETRLALAANLLDNGTLLITGSSAADAIVVQERDTDGSVAVRGVPGVVDGTVFSNVQRVRIEAGSGDDVISVTGIPRTTGGERLGFRVLGGNGSDVIRGGMGGDHLRGGNGSDQISGKDGADLLRGGKGNDILNGQKGADTLEGDDGDDLLLGAPGSDTLRGQGGDDVLRGGSGLDALSGGVGEDDLYGGSGDDELTGDGERDLLRGPINEFQDFDATDAFYSEVIGTGSEEFALLSETFWSSLDGQSGENDYPGSALVAVDSLQLLKARSADERRDFEEDWLELTEQRREEAREQTGGIIDDFLADIRDNPGDLTAARLVEFQLNVRDEFPDEVRDELDDYIEAMVELSDDLEALGDAMDDLEDDGLAGPFLDEFERFWQF